MRSVILGLLVVLTLVLAPTAVADGLASSEPLDGSNFFMEVLASLLDWLGIGEELLSEGTVEPDPAEFGAGLEPNG